MIWYIMQNHPKKMVHRKPVQTHLQVVKNLAGEYGKAFGAEKSAELCGLFHDFGKNLSPTFQNVLKRTQTGVDHAICGAAFLYFYQNCQKDSGKKPFRPAVEAIAAHHSHLVSQEDLAGVLETVLRTKDSVTTLSGKQAALCGGQAYQEAGQIFSVRVPQISASPRRKIFYPTRLWRGGKPLCCIPGCFFPVWWMPIIRHPLVPALEEERVLDVSDGLKRLYAYRQDLGAKAGADPVLNQFRNQLFERCGQARQRGDYLL